MGPKWELPVNIPADEATLRVRVLLVILPFGQPERIS